MSVHAGASALRLGVSRDMVPHHVTARGFRDRSLVCVCVEGGGGGGVKRSPGAPKMMRAGKWENDHHMIKKTGMYKH